MICGISTASAKAAAKPTAGDSILIDATAVSDLGLTAVEASEAVEMVLTNGGVTTHSRFADAASGGITRPDILSSECERLC